MKKRFLSELKKIKGLYYFVNEAMALRGQPDIIACYRGRFLGLELKRSSSCIYYKKDGRLRIVGRQKLQFMHLQRIYNAGGSACFVFPENMDNILEKIKNNEHFFVEEKWDWN